MTRHRTEAHSGNGGDVVAQAPRDALALALSDPDDGVLSGLDEAIAAIRRRTARLAYFIIRREYLPAWCEATELPRAIEQADVLAFAVLELPDTADIVRRLDQLHRVADGVLTLAPHPSSAAIREAFGSPVVTDRTLWASEILQWQAKLAAYRPPDLAGRALGSRSLADPHTSRTRGVKRPAALAIEPETEAL